MLNSHNLRMISHQEEKTEQHKRIKADLIAVLSIGILAVLFAVIATIK